MEAQSVTGSGDRAGTVPTDETPAAFRAALDALARFTPRPEVVLEPIPAPQRLAPHAVAMAARVIDPDAADDDAELAVGRFIVLFDPDGHEAWQGTTRCVGYLSAETDEHMVDDAMFSEVAWSWLTDALAEAGAGSHALGGTVTRTASTRSATSPAPSTRSTWRSGPPGRRRTPTSTGTSAPGSTCWATRPACRRRGCGCWVPPGSPAPRPPNIEGPAGLRPAVPAFLLPSRARRSRVNCGRSPAFRPADRREGGRQLSTDPALPPEETTPPAGEQTDGPAAVPLLAPREGLPPVIETSTQLVAYADALRDGTGPVAVDAERASGYRYGQRAYLVQLRRGGSGTGLVDPVPLPDVSVIQEAIADEEWVLHAANQDLPCLAEIGLLPKRIFDTELAARLAGLPRVGLGAVVESLLGFSLQKGHSAADWSSRPLPEEWLVYAALDVEVLVELRDALADILDEQGKAEWARQEFEAILAAGPPAPKADPWRRTSGVHALRNRRQLGMLRSLWQARDDLARARDVAPGRVLPDAAMVAAVQADPRTESALLELPVFRGRANRKLVGTWFGALARGRELPESELPPQSRPGEGPPPVNRWSDRDPAAATRLQTARAGLAALSEQWSVPVENLLSPDLVRRLMWSPPEPRDAAAVAEALRAGGAREWQVELAGPVLTGALAAA